MATPDLPAPLDEPATEAFAGRVVDIVTDGLLSFLLDIGRRVGLFEAAALGPATSTELAARAQLTERYVREWLAAMTTARILEYDPATGRYRLPPEHAASLTGPGPENLTPLAYLATVLGRHVPAVASAFRSGGGVPYEAYLPELHDVMDALWRPLYTSVLVDDIVPLAPGLPAALARGARGADVACGSGIALLELATAYPASQFHGFDTDPGGIERARAQTAERELRNVAFDIADAATLRVPEPFDAVFVFNALHDMAAPEQVLRRLHDALRPGGLLVLDEPRMSDRLEDNLGHPMAPFTYAVSTLHCLTVSLAVGGAGLGAAWGEQTALRLLGDAGFGPVSVYDAPGDPGNAVFVTARG